MRWNLSTSNKRGGTRYLTFAFTEQGVSSLSAVLNSDKAIDVHIYIMRAFVFVRQYALSHKDLTDKLNKLETQYNMQFKNIYDALNFLIQKDKQITEQLERKPIGFKRKDEEND